jgi:hypothetical protein
VIREATVARFAIEGRLRWEGSDCTNAYSVHRLLNGRPGSRAALVDPYSILFIRS